MQGEKGGEKEHEYIFGSGPGPGQLSEMVGYRHVCPGRGGWEEEMRLEPR